MGVSIFEEFDKKFDSEQLAKDTKEAEANGGTGAYKEVPLGHYEVKIDKLELVASKSSGKPMVSCWFQIVNGEYRKQRIFMNQVITEAFQLSIVKKFLRSLLEECDDAPEVEFETYTQFGNLLMDIAEAIDGKYEYGLRYDQTAKGFSTFEITDIFEA